MPSLRKDDTGTAVTTLQRRLQAVGLKTEADGWFGPVTEAAVIAFQRRAGLVADGIAGPKTLAALEQRDTDPKHLAEADLIRAADRLGVPLAAIKAVNEVETRGAGFLPDGRPVILYERHVALARLLEHGATQEQANALAARYPAILNPKRGGYAGGAAEWSRVASARQALPDWPGIPDEACSWGQYQIMGYHWQHLGYASIDDFVSQMQSGEAQQLEVFCRFIEAEPALLKALKARKWADFAKGYNGPAYKENLYDTKLAAAFERHSALLGEEQEAA